MFEYFSYVFGPGVWSDLFSYISTYGDEVLLWLPLWGPFVFGYMFYQSWMSYIRRLNIFEEERVLLEINLPEEQKKAPDAMELALQGLHQDSIPGKFIGKFWEGNVYPWFSLELVSLEGEVHMFIWTSRFHRQIIENNIYSQYPEVEISEVPDYTDFLQFDTDLFDLWGAEFTLKEDDPYPLKTYVDYGFEGGIDEDEQVDPMTPILEYLGSLRRGEQAWIQILVKAHDKKKQSGRIFATTDHETEGEKLIDELMKRDPDSKLPEGAAEEDAGGPGPQLSDEEEATIDAIERNISKLSFDCGIRGLYIAEQDQFRNVNIPGMIGAFKQFNARGRNGFKPTGGTTMFDYDWQDYKDRRKQKTKRKLFRAYRRRSYFYPPNKRTPFVLSAEELATIYHFPGQVSQTPSFKRIESKKAQPPSDLPV
jgi:hypothetical protein